MTWAKEEGLIAANPLPRVAARAGREADERRDQLMLVLERALGALDRDGLFGIGEDRDNVVLKIAIVDADEDEWDFMVASMKRMNSSKSLERFLALLEELEGWG